MRRFVRAALLVIILLLIRSTIPSSPVAAQSDAPYDDPPVWAPLGPSGVFQAGQIAVSSGWPADPFLLVTLSGADDRYGLPSSPPPAARTYDGGRTWEPLPGFPEGQVSVIWTRQYGRVLLHRAGETRYGPPPGPLSRSTDDGRSWAHSRPSTSRDSRTQTDIAIVSPNVYEDAHIIVLEDGQAFQSYDAGATWEPLDPVPGQRIGTVRFSPDVANDGTLYLTANSGSFASFSGQQDNRAQLHHADSAGILISRDHGRTWESTAAGLQIEGDPYRQIASLAISPTFARDGTLFAYAWGPWLGDDPKQPRGPHTALFRSQDRGQTWASVWEPFSRTLAKRNGVRSRAYVTPVLSPAHADNGLILATQGGSSGSPGSGHCNILRSDDFGQTWTSRGVVSSYGTCYGLRFAGDDPTLALWYQTSSGSGGWYSTDRRLSVPFASRQQFGPRKWIWSPRSFPEPAIGPDGTIFTFGTGGVWMFGPLERSTFGRLPCATEEAEPYASARLAAPYAQPWLGCPAGAPYTVAVRERTVGDTRALWTEDDDPRAIVLTVARGHAHGLASFIKKDAHTWPGQPDRIVQAEVQRYEGGLMVRQPANDGHAATVLVAAGFGWQEVAAP